MTTEKVLYNFYLTLLKKRYKNLDDKNSSVNITDVGKTFYSLVSRWFKKRISHNQSRSLKCPCSWQGGWN